FSAFCRLQEQRLFRLHPPSLVCASFAFQAHPVPRLLNRQGVSHGEEKVVRRGNDHGTLTAYARFGLLSNFVATGVKNGIAYV
ncbi:unnamed protein product, partial [Mycena citricolor]